MSIPFLKFICDSCDYHESSFVTFGRFFWNDDGHTFNFDRQLGLCQDCKAIVAMEKFPEPQEFEEAKKLHLELCGKFVNPFTTSYVRQLASREGFEILERVIELRRPPVCLKCGGSDVQPLVLPEVPDGAKRTDMALTPLGVTHPGCGGNLQVKGSGGLRISLNPVTYYFGIDGKAFATLNDSPNPREEKLPPPPRATIKSPTRSKDWCPDWGAFVSRGKAVEITFEDPELNIFPEVDVVEEWEGCFRIYGYAFSDLLYWGDLFEGEFDGHDSIHFIRLLDRPRYLHFGGIFPPRNAPVPYTEKDWVKEFPYLQRVMRVGGYWEYNGPLGLYVVIPEKCLSDFPEFDGKTPEVLNEPPGDVKIQEAEPVSNEGRIFTRRSYSNASGMAAEKDRKRRIRKLFGKIPD